MDLRGVIDTNTIIVGDFYTLLTSINRSTRQKLSKEAINLTQTTEQMDLIGMYRTFHPMDTEYSCFSVVHGTFSKIDHMKSHKTKLTNFKKLKSYHASSQTTTE